METATATANYLRRTDSISDINALNELRAMYNEPPLIPSSCVLQNVGDK